MDEGRRAEIWWENRGKRGRWPADTGKQTAREARLGFAAKRGGSMAGAAGPGPEGERDQHGRRQQKAHLPPVSAVGGLFLRFSGNTL